MAACEPVTGQVPTACRNSFNQLISSFLADLDVAVDDCPVDGQMFNATVTPTLNFPVSFLQVAADTLCSFGIDLTVDGVDFSTVQVRVDALAGATCTSQLSELAGTPVNLPLPSTGDCTAGITVTTPIEIVLPTVEVPCTAGAAPGPVGFCATGTTPAAAAPGATAVDTWAAVDIGFPTDVSFQCGDGLTSPTTACTGDPDCAAIVGNEGTVSTCDLAEETCTTVPLDLDPATDCVTIPVVP
jgi:hypothetical protein